MEEEEIVNQILKYIPKIDFTTTKAANQGISVFETTIRYLGGLISSKTQPFDDLEPSDTS